MARNTRLQMTWRQPAYLACVTVLVLGILGMSAIERALGLVLTKKPLLLIAPLTALDNEQLKPYHVAETFTIDDPTLQETLGTEDYIQWVLQDSRRRPTDPAHQVLLFVTYYALPDKVPHVPEECYLGSGFQRLATDSLHVHIPAEGGSSTVPARYLVFSSDRSSMWTQGQRIPVVYLFRVNGDYAGSRDEARLALNRNMFGPASYFSKVELVFNRSLERMTQEQVRRAAQDLLAVVLPLLERGHWPAWPPQEDNLNRELLDTHRQRRG